MISNIEIQPKGRKMSLYKNQKCPVCEEVFADGDDIVVCPECGTPHHRECYKTLGHCANADKHGTGFEFEAEEMSEEKAEDGEQSSAFRPFIMPEAQTTVCEKCGREIEKGSAFCTYCGERQESPAFLSAYSAVNSKAFQEDSGIDGYSATELSSAIVVNTNKFITKFRKNKKISWNWSAFIFGPYYFFYRKMMKYGLLALVINLIVSLVLNGVFAKQLSAYNAVVSSEQYKELFTNGFANSELMAQFSAEPAVEALMPVMLVFALCTLALRVVFALFADGLYRKHVLKMIDTVNKQLEEDMAEDMPMIPQLQFRQNQKSEPLSKKQLKILLLNQRGGTSVFLPLAAFFALQFIMSVITGY